MDLKRLQRLARLVRYFILVSTSEAGSGHPTSGLSAADLMTVLFFSGFFRADLEDPKNPANDRLIFSKGHASPLFYALYAAAGKISESELLKLRKFDSPLEGHPSMRFPYAEAATGSLGQGLSIGLGMALAAKFLTHRSNRFYRSYVLLGDSEMAEGSVWEAIQIAAHYKLDNLVAILDVNRLGQRGETMYGHDVRQYQKRIAAFGWETIVIDGHSILQIQQAYKKALAVKNKPVMIIAKTIKGKGVSFLENADNWHGKAVPKEKLETALRELGMVEVSLRGKVPKPKKTLRSTSFLLSPNSQLPTPNYPKSTPVPTRRAYGNALVRVFPAHPNMAVLDAEVSNSTLSEIFQKAHPERFFEMYIAEQNMVGTALGMSRRGIKPFVSTFGAFFTRAFDQIRMAQYSDPDIVFCGSHTGVSIGEDGPSQMGLEDIALFRTLRDSAVLYPSDAVSCERLVEKAAARRGITYIRTTRKDTPILYGPDESFSIGGSKTLKKSPRDQATAIGAGVTLHEALAAHEELKKEGILIRVIDLYSVKPLDQKTLERAAKETKAILTVEDHYPEGGIGEAVSAALAQSGFGTPVSILAVRKIPRSGKPDELLEYEEISRNAIIRKVKEVLRGKTDHSTRLSLVGKVTKSDFHS